MGPKQQSLAEDIPPTLTIVADREIPEIAAAFAPFGEVVLVDGRHLLREQILEADVLLVRSVTSVDQRLLDGSKVRFVGTATSGLDHLDLDYLEKHQIEAFDAAGCNARAVAEHVIACSLLHLSPHARPFEDVRVGIVGHGHVGRIVESLFNALGAQCLINDPPLAARIDNANYVDLKDVLCCDIVTLHVPFVTTGEHPTKDLISVAELGALEPGALLINSARGGVINEAALSDWLGQQTTRAAAIDCWQDEPIVNRKLLRLAALATPHIAGHTQEARLSATRLLSHQFARRLKSSTHWELPVANPIDLNPTAVSAATCGEVIRRTVLQVYDPRLATTDMRQCLSLPTAKRAARFDELRRQAAVRHEFRVYRVASDSLESDTVNKLRGLGFATTRDGVTDSGNDER